MLFRFWFSWATGTSRGSESAACGLGLLDEIQELLTKNRVHFRGGFGIPAQPAWDTKACRSSWKRSMSILTSVALTLSLSLSLTYLLKVERKGFLTASN